MATYTLPATNTVSGTIQVTITSDVAGLTVPSIDTLLAIGPKQETLTEELGVIELSTLSMTVRDDTSVHSQGFWYRLLDESTDLRIRVSLLEGGSYNDFFYGVLSKEEIIWDELYIGTPRIRTANFTLVSVIAKLFDIDFGQFLDDAYAHSLNYECEGNTVSSNFKFLLPLSAVIGVAMKTAGLNAGIYDAEFVFDPSYPDLKFLDVSSNEFVYDEVYLPTAYEEIGALSGRYTWKHEYWNSASADSLDALYGGDFKTFLGDFLFNFGFMLRIVYNGSYFQAYLYQRYGRAYSTLITLGSEIESTLILPSPLRTTGVKVALKNDANSPYWFHDSKAKDGSTATVPEELDFDIDRGLLWRAPVLGGGGTYHNKEAFGVWDGTGGPEFVKQAVNFKYFDASAAALQATTATTQALRMQRAIAGYHYKALILQNKSYQRQYSGVAATTGGVTSHLNLSVLRRAEIADGTANDTFYANKVTVDPNKYVTEIEWIKETSAVL